MDDSVGLLKVSELKAQLSAKGLETSGVKSTLQKRLREALKAGGESAPAEPEEAKAEEDVIDESTRYSGTVFKFIKRRGFGRIIPEGKTAEDKDDMVFVHWKQIQSSEKWPALSEGQAVEYYLGKKANPKDPKKAVFAASVTLAGGQQVTTSDDRDFPDRSQRFEGVVDFFNRGRGFGFIKPKADFNFDETDFSADKKATIYVCREDIKTVDDTESVPSLKNGADVEFALYKTTNKKGETRYAAGDVTMPGNTPLTEGDFKPKPTPEELKERRKRGQKRKRSQKAKKGKKGKNQKTPTGAFKMNGMTFIPMQQQAQPQIVMMNGQPYMVMPQQQQFGGMMGGMQFANNLVGFGQQPKKKRRKNKKGKKKNDTTTNW